MNPRSFPKTITIQLPEALRRGLETIATREHDDDGDLLLVVLSRGIVATLAPDEPEVRMQELKARDASPRPTRPLRIQGIDSGRIPFGMKQTLEEQRAMEAEHDNEKARFRRDLGLTEDVDPHAHRHLPQLSSVRLSEEMRQALEDFLDAHPDLDENDALSILVRRGLEHTTELEDVVQTAREKSASRILNLAEKLYARSKRRCRW